MTMSEIHQQLKRQREEDERKLPQPKIKLLPIGSSPIPPKPTAQPKQDLEMLEFPKNDAELMDILNPTFDFSKIDQEPDVFAKPKHVEIVPKQQPVKQEPVKKPEAIKPKNEPGKQARTRFNGDLHWTPIPTGLIRYRGIFTKFKILTDKEILVIQTLYTYRGEQGIFPSQDSLSEHLGISKINVYKALSEIRSKKGLCPICENYEYSILGSTSKGDFRKTLNYHTDGIEKFIAHLDSHSREEIEAAVESLDKRKPTGFLDKGELG